MCLTVCNLNTQKHLGVRFLFPIKVTQKRLQSFCMSLPISQITYPPLLIQLNMCILLFSLLSVPYIKIKNICIVLCFVPLCYVLYDLIHASVK